MKSNCAESANGRKDISTWVSFMFYHIYSGNLRKRSDIVAKNFSHWQE